MSTTHKIDEKNASYILDKECQEAFDSINKYPLNLSILVALILWKPLILCTKTLEESIDALLTQYNDEGIKNALHYIN